ncbi:MAG: protein-glutamate O-methyltransferase CheR, partial [Marinospirillum sp.]|nr:protein-glutamate O-methyltransferase CheR [Marinospirillum sp.]
MSDDLRPFKELIKNHCGLLLEGIAEDRLRKALQTAAQVEGKKLGDLLPLLQKNQDLTKDLVSQLTVNETYFFRENAQIQLLTSHLIPRLFSLHGKNRPLKIL